MCVFLCPIVRRCVRTCGIRQRYQLQPLVHFSPSSLNHHLHLILGAPFLFFLPLSFFLSCLLSKYLLGTPDTSLRGLSTLNALRALTSKPAAFPPIGVAPSPLVACSKIALNNLCHRNEYNKYYHPFKVNLRISDTKVNRDITSSTATVCGFFHPLLPS